jgi:hypothetical protein
LTIPLYHIFFLFLSFTIMTGGWRYKGVLRRERALQVHQLSHFALLETVHTSFVIID